MRLALLAIVLGLVIGALIGIGGYTFVYAKGYSYLTNDPAACANCHVMGQYYSGWVKGAHRSVAVCNDCHTPHNLLGKYATKASNGFRHSFYFTTGWFPDTLEITSRNMRVTEDACRRCHAAIVNAIDAHPAQQHGGRLSCLRCHADVGHM